MEERMSANANKGVSFLIFLFCLTQFLNADRRDNIYNLGLELEKQAHSLAEMSFDHFKGWNRVISDEEQSVLFKSESFLASCRLFLKLAAGSSGYFRPDYLQTSLYNAFMYLARSFRELEEEMKKSRVMPFALANCRRILERMDQEFFHWPSADNLAYLHQKYVKAQDARVFMIERKAPGVYVRHAFKNLESLYRYNYDLKRGKDPWKYLVEISYETLEKMEEGSLIDLTFEGYLLIEQGTRPNRSVFLIEKGKRRGITSPEVLMRFGGWGKVYEVPAEIIYAYPEGDPIY